MGSRFFLPERALCYNSPALHVAPRCSFMKYTADLHIHSYLSRACSKSLVPEILYQWCQLKGVTVLSTGDFTHPKWIQELKEKIEPAEPGLFELKTALAKP